VAYLPRTEPGSAWKNETSSLASYSRRSGLKTTIIAGAAVALLTGIAIGTQSTITSRVGGIIGDVRTGLLTNFSGGVVAGLLVLIVLCWEGTESWRMPGTVLGLAGLSGAMGIFIITGISFSLQRAGVAAGLATILLGQLALSTLVDTFGVGGAEPIPLSFQRVLGLLVTALGVLLILPRN
jgi:transporter family-2 protein